MYRISAEGVRRLAEHDGVAPAPLAPVGDDPSDAGTFFLPHQVAPALDALRARATADRGEWMSLRQLAAGGVRLDSADADWLLRNGLLERRRRQGSSTSGEWSFRVTPAGLRLETTAPPSQGWVRVRLQAPPG